MLRGSERMAQLDSRKDQSLMSRQGLLRDALRRLCESGDHGAVVLAMQAVMNVTSTPLATIPYELVTECRMLELLFEAMDRTPSAAADVLLAVIALYRTACSPGHRVILEHGGGRFLRFVVQTLCGDEADERLRGVAVVGLRQVLLRSEGRVLKAVLTTLQELLPGADEIGRLLSGILEVLRSEARRSCIDVHMLCAAVAALESLARSWPNTNLRVVLESAPVRSSMTAVLLGLFQHGEPLTALVSPVLTLLTRHLSMEIEDAPVAELLTCADPYLLQDFSPFRLLRVGSWPAQQKACLLEATRKLIEQQPSEEEAFELVVREGALEMYVEVLGKILPDGAGAGEGADSDALLTSVVECLRVVMEKSVVLGKELVARGLPESLKRVKASRGPMVLRAMFQLLGAMARDLGKL
jgi:hypothetical protein